MISYKAALKLQDAGFRKPKRIKQGQNWYTPNKKPCVAIKGDDHGEFVLLIVETGLVSQFRLNEMVYAPSADEILREIANRGKHRLLGMQPGSTLFEINGSNLHQYQTGRNAANSLAKEFVAIVLERV